MDISYRGANCVVIKSKQALIVVDPTNNAKANEITNKDTIVLATQTEFMPKNAVFAIDMPGEYEYNDISIQGIPMSRHIDPDGKNSTLYKIDLDGVKIVILGHIVAPITDDDLEKIGMVDIAVVPIGGGGYTLDARDASTVMRQLSPKIIIPTYYDDGKTKYDVPQESIEQFIGDMGAAHEKVSSLKLKNGLLPEVITVYEITLR